MADNNIQQETIRGQGEIIRNKDAIIQRHEGLERLKKLNGIKQELELLNRLLHLGSGNEAWRELIDNVTSLLARLTEVNNNEDIGDSIKKVRSKLLSLKSAKNIDTAPENVREFLSEINGIIVKVQGQLSDSLEPPSSASYSSSRLSR